MLLLFISSEKANKTFYILFTIDFNLPFKFNLNTNITLKPSGPQTLRQPKSDFQDSVVNFTVQYLY